MRALVPRIAALIVCLTIVLSTLGVLAMYRPQQPVRCPRAVHPWDLISYSLGPRGDEVNCHYIRRGVR